MSKNGIIIVDYGTGNLGSIANMLKYLGLPSKISSDISDIENADKLILPGVGSFDHGMRNIRKSNIAVGVFMHSASKGFEDVVIGDWTYFWDQVQVREECIVGGRILDNGGRK